MAADDGKAPSDSNEEILRRVKDSLIAHVKASTRGVAHHHTDEELRAYRALTPDQKLRWLEEAWQLTARLLPAQRREIHRRLRAGEL